MRHRPILVALCAAATMSCAGAGAASGSGSAAAAPLPSGATIARVYYWRAKPGKLEEYSRYVRDVAEPIDHEAQRRGAFLAVTTLVSRDPASPWTHMRIFFLRDSAQLAGLSAQLDSAGMRLEPDAAKRRERSQYSATLRDPAGDATLAILH
jgi:hypothetical protein